MIRRIALVGLGTMGPGIAARLARGGMEVTAFDVSDSAIERTHGLLKIAEGVLDHLEIKPPVDRPGSIELSSDLAACVASADLVIENVPENAAVKAGVYRDIEALVEANVLIATDTSGIPISTLQKTLQYPGRFVGMHWSNPPHIVPMIEVIAGQYTRPDVVDSMCNCIRGMGLLPVVIKKDVPGFVENRVLYAMLREVVDLVEQGVIDPEDMDTCVSWGIGFKTAVIGPMALLDMAGLDIYKSVSSFLNQELCNRQDVSPMVEQRHAAGRLGLKSGGGMYEYQADEIPTLQKARAAKLVAIRRVLEGRNP